MVNDVEVMASINGAYHENVLISFKIHTQLCHSEAYIVYYMSYLLGGGEGSTYHYVQMRDGYL